MTHFIANARIAGQLQHHQALEADERTLMEKAQDDQIAMDRLTINSALSIDAGYKFIAELDAAQDRNARQAIIEKWRAYAVLESAHREYLAHGDIVTVYRHRLSKAAAAAMEAGWEVKSSKWGQIKSVSWPVAE